MAPRELLDWFQTLVQKLREAGVPAHITSGLACVHYNLAETTKDCDLWTPPHQLADFKEFLATQLWGDSRVLYRSRLSAPLDSRWLSGGWSAYLGWSGPPFAQLDVFGRLPRVRAPLSQGIFSDLETLARVKMSQREKDWPTVHLLGEHLLAQNNSRGLLFVGEAERLVQAYQETPESWQVLVSVRPLLAQVAKEPSLAKLQAFLRIERTFWQQVDHLRMEAYKAAGRDYAKAGGEILRTKSTFEEQDPGSNFARRNVPPAKSTPRNGRTNCG